MNGRNSPARRCRLHYKMGTRGGPGTSRARLGDRSGLSSDDHRAWRIPDDVVGYGSENGPLYASPAARPDDDRCGVHVLGDRGQALGPAHPRPQMLQRCPAGPRSLSAPTLLLPRPPCLGLEPPGAAPRGSPGVQLGPAWPVASSANEDSDSTTETTSTLSDDLRIASPSPAASMARSEPSVHTTSVFMRLRVSMRRFVPGSQH